MCIKTLCDLAGLRKLTGWLALAFIVVSCQPQSTDDNDEMPGKQLLTGSEWIASSEMLSDEDSLFYLDQPAPRLSKTFDLQRGIDEAELIITAAGYYVAWVNGERVGDHHLSPAWTDYGKRIYFHRFPVKKSLRRGENQIEVELGNGWFNPLPLRMWGHRNIRESLTVGKPRMILALRVQYKNGEEQIIRSDGTWEWCQGPVRRNSVYLGEWHDYRFDEAAEKKSVMIMEGPGGKLEEAFFPPIRKTARVQPEAIWKNAPGRVTVDFGQNLAGWMRYSGPAKAGDTIRFRYGERIWEDSSVNTLTAVAGQIKRKGVGGPGSPDVAEQVDVYIPTNDQPVFEPRFTFHGFRYVEISGLDPDAPLPERDDLIAYRLGSDVAKTGRIETDLEWLNQIQKMVEWTLSSNLFSVPSDCPAREKFGYGGDLNQNAEAFLYNYDMKQIFSKFLYDWKDAIREGKYVDTAPFVGISYCGLSWEATFLLLQDWLYTFYGDEALIKTWYAYDQEWINKVINTHGTDLVRDGLADHESLLPVPVELIGTTYYYKVLTIMKRFARIMEDDPFYDLMDEQSQSIRQIMIDSLWKDPVKPIRNPQTWYAALLYMDVLPETESREAFDRLVTAWKENDHKLTTGIFGTPFLLDVLSKNGYALEVYNMIKSREFPGWRFMLDNGATTLWETWKESDNTFSQNHPMFGAVSTWFYKYLAGFQPEMPGFKTIRISPCFPEDMNDLQAQCATAGGTLTLKWERQGEKIFCEVDVPEGTQAIWDPELNVPLDPVRLDGKGRYRFQVELKD